MAITGQGCTFRAIRLIRQREFIFVSLLVPRNDQVSSSIEVTKVDYHLFNRIREKKILRNLSGYSGCRHFIFNFVLAYRNISKLDYFDSLRN